ncbi:MAG: hypothetical protein WD802_00550 [Gemmatimonadaceae bacterium]
MAPFIPVAPKKKLADKADKAKSTSLPVPQPTRIGFGEYSHPTLFDKAKLYAQLEFIQKIEEVAQEVLVDLAESVRPNYEGVRTLMDESELLSLDAKTLRSRAKNARNEFAALLASLEAWIEKHSLDADWVRNMVLRTLFHWTGRDVVGGPPLRFTAPISAKKAEMIPQPFLFSDFGWKITNETRKAFGQRIKAEFNSSLAGYLTRVEQSAEKAGWTKTPEIRKSGKDSDSFRHFEWLVRWQCQNWTTVKIAKKYGRGNPRKVKSPKKSAVIPDSGTRAHKRGSYAAKSDRRRNAAYQTVHGGLTKTAQLLDLRLRPGKETAENILSQ